MVTLIRPLTGFILVGLFAVVGCQPRRFNEMAAQSVGGAGNGMVEELLTYHKNAMSPDLVSKLGDTSFYVFNRGCAAGMPADEVSRRPIEGARDPSYSGSPDPFPHPDTCQNSYIDPANYDMRGVVRRKFDSTPGSSSAGTPRMEGESSVLDVFQISPSSPRYRKRCYNSLPSGRAIYRVYSNAQSNYNGTPYYEVRSHDVTVGVIVDISRVVNEGLDRSSSDQLDLESGFYPRVYLMPGLCGVSSPWGSSKAGKTPGGLPGSLPAPGCNPVAQSPVGQNPVGQNQACAPGAGGVGSNPTSQNPVLQQPTGQSPVNQQPGGVNNNPAQQNPTSPAQGPVLTPKLPNGSSQQ